MVHGGVSRVKLKKAHDAVVATALTETATLISYPGYAEMLADLAVATPEEALQESIDALQIEWDKAVAPHSPLSPEQALTTGALFTATATLGHIGLTAVMTAIEVAGLGQLETPAIMTMSNPAFQAMMDTARSVPKAYFDAAFVKGVGYKANFDHMPTIPPPDILTSAVNMGLITDALYKGTMRYHGFTEWNSALIKQSNIRMPDPNTIIDLYRRGILSKDGAVDWLVLNRIPRATAAAVTELAWAPPEPYRLAEFHAKGLTTYDEYITAMAVHGIPYEWAADWFTAALLMPTFDQCIVMYRRGILSDEEFTEYMKLNAYGSRQINQMKLLKDVIPPISDLIRFAVREAYGDHDPEKQLPTMVDVASKMGLNKEAAEWYWYSHWERIPISYMFANYYRGRWTREKLARMLKIVDVHPDDREDIISVAYQPPTVRELGYGFDVGVYTLEDISKYRAMSGLSPQDAAKSADAMVAYRTEAERNSVRTELMYAYGRGKITRDELENRLAVLPTRIEAIELWLDRAELYKQRIQKPEMDTEGLMVSSSEAISAFKLGLRDEMWARARLVDLGWVQERIDVVIEKAKKEIADATKPLEEVAPRALTITQLTSMYRLQIIDKGTFEAELVIMGYSPDTAALLVEVYTREEPVVTAVKPYSVSTAEKMYHYQMLDEGDIYENYLLDDYDSEHAGMLTIYSLLNIEYPVLATLYEKGYITSEAIKLELMKIGLDDYDAQKLVERTQYEYQVSRLAPERDLTKAEIIKGAKNNVFTFAQAVEMLMGIGYDSDESQYLLILNKVVQAGDPESYLEMKQVVEAYKKARGLKSMEITKEMLDLEKQIKDVRTELDKERKLGVNETKIGELAVKLGGLESQLRTLLRGQATK
jgi:hypothetical protein